MILIDIVYSYNRHLITNVVHQCAMFIMYILVFHEERY